jgi:hypothetical protein
MTDTTEQTESKAVINMQARISELEKKRDYLVECNVSLQTRLTAAEGENGDLKDKDCNQQIAISTLDEQLVKSEDANGKLRGALEKVWGIPDTLIPLAEDAIARNHTKPDYYEGFKEGVVQIGNALSVIKQALQPKQEVDFKPKSQEMVYGPRQCPECGESYNLNPHVCKPKQEDKPAEKPAVIKIEGGVINGDTTNAIETFEPAQKPAVCGTCGDSGRVKRDGSVCEDYWYGIWKHCPDCKERGQ